jgi:hypothetical protein
MSMLSVAVGEAVGKGPPPAIVVASADSNFWRDTAPAARPSVRGKQPGYFGQYRT